MAGRKEPQKLNLSREVTGLILLALGIFMGLVFFWPHSRSGALGAFFYDIARGICGPLAYVLPFFLIYSAVEQWLDRVGSSAKWRRIHFALLLLLIAGSIQLLTLDHKAAFKLAVNEQGEALATKFIQIIWSVSADNTAVKGLETAIGAGILGGLPAAGIFALTGYSGSLIFYCFAIIAEVILLFNISISRYVRQAHAAAGEHKLPELSYLLKAGRANKGRVAVEEQTDIGRANKSGTNASTEGYATGTAGKDLRGGRFGTYTDGFAMPWDGSESAEEAGAAVGGVLVGERVGGDSVGGGRAVGEHVDGDSVGGGRENTTNDSGSYRLANETVDKTWGSPFGTNHCPPPEQSTTVNRPNMATKHNNWSDVNPANFSAPPTQTTTVEAENNNDDEGFWGKLPSWLLKKDKRDDRRSSAPNKMNFTEGETFGSDSNHLKFEPIKTDTVVLHEVKIDKIINAADAWNQRSAISEKDPQSSGNENEAEHDVEHESEVEHEGEVVSTPEPSPENAEEREISNDWEPGMELFPAPLRVAPEVMPSASEKKDTLGGDVITDEAEVNDISSGDDMSLSPTKLPTVLRFAAAAKPTVELNHIAAPSPTLASNDDEPAEVNNVTNIVVSKDNGGTDLASSENHGELREENADSGDAVMPTAGAVASTAIPAAGAAASTAMPAAMKTTNAVKHVYPAEKEYKFPPLELLKPEKPTEGISQANKIKELSERLETTLMSFGVKAKVINVTHGPSITRFELAPAPGIKVSKIVGLSDDIALSLAAVSVRIEAPIPGKPAIGIEIPNKETQVVGLRELLADPAFRRAPSKLTVVLGRDIPGQPVLCDLRKMPHLMIAGATGSGKSVCINCILMSILYKAHPRDVKLLMIDPKVVELKVYNGIPHLLAPVVTDPKKAANTLNWAVNEMDRRYRMFAEHGARDYDSYSQIAESEDLEKIPLILLVIDELADLMTTCPNEVEDAIARLTAMARAAGIHLIIATQRPSVDVITGVIKSNIPSRIAFAVSSQVDSRTILDSAGAEKLLGKGDMLYNPLNLPKPIRAQGAFVSDKEVETVIAFLKAQNRTEYDEKIATEIETATINSNSSKANAEDSGDDLLPQAVEIILDNGYASVSILQRKMNIGYPRAARLIDAMEELGYVGPFEGSKPRKVRLTRAEWEAQKAVERGE